MRIEMKDATFKPVQIELESMAELMMVMHIMATAGSVQQFDAKTRNLAVAILDGLTEHKRSME
jgi:hypothetical protein